MSIKRRYKVSTQVTCWVEQEIEITCNTEEEIQEVINQHITDLKNGWGDYTLFSETSKVNVIDTDVNMESCVLCGDDGYLYIEGYDDDLDVSV